MRLSKDSGIDMSETEIEPGLTIKRKVTLADVEVERDIVDLEKKSKKNKPVGNGAIE